MSNSPRPATVNGKPTPGIPAVEGCYASSAAVDPECRRSSSDGGRRSGQGAPEATPSVTRPNALSLGVGSFDDLRNTRLDRQQTAPDLLHPRCTAQLIAGNDRIDDG